MQRDNIIEKIKSVVKNVCQIEEFCEKSKLKEELGLDSLSLVALIVALEEEFKITFSDSDLDPNIIIDVKSLIDLVEKNI